MTEKEKKLMAIYRETRSPGVFVGVPGTISHLPWSLLAIAVGLMLWLAIAVVNAENLRHALVSKACQDRVFPAELDQRCLAFVQTRAHWWQHLQHALSHLGS